MADLWDHLAESRACDASLSCCTVRVRGGCLSALLSTFREAYIRGRVALTHVGACTRQPRRHRRGRGTSRTADDCRSEEEECCCQLPRAVYGTNVRTTLYANLRRCWPNARVSPIACRRSGSSSLASRRGVRREALQHSSVPCPGLACHRERRGSESTSRNGRSTTANGPHSQRRQIAKLLLQVVGKSQPAQ
jgi:hypothetical protein